MTRLFISKLLEERSAAAIHPAHFREDRSKGQHFDLLAFISLKFAWDCRDHPAAIRYFYPVFDVEGKGYITQVGAQICAGMRNGSSQTHLPPPSAWVLMCTA